MRARLAELLFAGLLLAAALCVAFLSTRLDWRHDFSHAQRASLDTRTLQLLERLDGTVTITSYAGPDVELRRAIADFVQRYQRAKPDIALRFVDPDADPAATRAAGIRIDGEMVVRYHDREERLKVLTERELDNALVRLARTRTRLVAFLSGDGERRPDGKANADLGQFATLLAAQGVRATALTLSDGMHIPQNVDVLVVAAPQVEIAKGVAAELVDYVQRGGNLLWLAEPGAQHGLATLAQALSVRVLDGEVVDGAGAAFGIGDPSFVAVTHFPDSVITHDFTLTTLFPQCAALGIVSGTDWRAQSLLRSSEKSWTRIAAPQDAADSIAFDAARGEIAGPLDLGVALSRLSPSPARAEQRAVVIGDGDFLSNAFLGNGGNREFGQRIFDWLLQDDALIDIPEKLAPDRQLVLGQTSLGFIGLGFLVAVPGALLLAGWFIWWRRRRA